MANCHLKHKVVFLKWDLENFFLKKNYTELRTPQKHSNISNPITL